MEPLPENCRYGRGLHDRHVCESDKEFEKCSRKKKAIENANFWQKVREREQKMRLLSSFLSDSELDKLLKRYRNKEKKEQKANVHSI